MSSAGWISQANHPMHGELLQVKLIIIGEYTFTFQLNASIIQFNTIYNDWARTNGLTLESNTDVNISTVVKLYDTLGNHKMSTNIELYIANDRKNEYFAIKQETMESMMKLCKLCCMNNDIQDSDGIIQYLCQGAVIQGCPVHGYGYYLKYEQKRLICQKCNNAHIDTMKIDIDKLLYKRNVAIYTDHTKVDIICYGYARSCDISYFPPNCLLKMILTYLKYDFGVIHLLDNFGRHWKRCWNPK